MKSDEFNAIKSIINQTNLSDDGRLKIQNVYLHLLTRSQWKEFGEILAAKKPSAVELFHCGTVHFLESTWQSLFNVFATLRVDNFVISHDSLNQFTDFHWKNLFKYIPATINRIGFRLCNLDQVHISQCPSLFEGLSSQFTEIDLSGNKLFLSTAGFCSSFINELEKSTILKRLIIGNDVVLGDSENCIWHDSQVTLGRMSMSYLGLDSNGLYRLTEQSWLKFCHDIQQSQISTLSVQSNHFYNFTANDWAWYFKGLKLSPVTILDISEYHSLELDDEKEMAFFDGLKNSRITHLIHCEQNQFTLEQQKMLTEILQQNQRKKASLPQDCQNAHVYSNSEEELKSKVISIQPPPSFVKTYDLRIKDSQNVVLVSGKRKHVEDDNAHQNSTISNGVKKNISTFSTTLIKK